VEQLGRVQGCLPVFSLAQDAVSLSFFLREDVLQMPSGPGEAFSGEVNSLSVLARSFFGDHFTEGLEGDRILAAIDGHSEFFH